MWATWSVDVDVDMDVTMDGIVVMLDGNSMVKFGDSGYKESRREGGRNGEDGDSVCDDEKRSEGEGNNGEEGIRAQLMGYSSLL